jgi:hypothetical protein
VPGRTFRSGKSNDIHTTQLVTASAVVFAVKGEQIRGVFDMKARKTRFLIAWLVFALALLALGCAEKITSTCR